jgi:hypothetical protein
VPSPYQRYGPDGVRASDHAGVQDLEGKRASHPGFLRHHRLGREPSPPRRSLQRPLLRRAGRAAHDDQGRPVRGATAHRVETFTADPDNLAIRDAPVLARPAVAGDQYHRRTVGRGAALHVHAAASGARDLTGAQRPLLIGAAMTMKEDEWRSIDGVAVGKIDALAAGAHDLRGSTDRDQGHRCEGQEAQQQ